VLIATPVSTHHRLGIAALEAGKHVFIEKPLAASSEQATSLIQAADERGLVVMPGHTFLYSPPVTMIRSLIEAGELGDVYFVSTSRVNLGLHQPDVSVAWDLGPHDFSMLRYWLDDTPTHVSALARGCIIPSIPDVAFIDLEYASGTVAHVELSWLAPSKLRRTTIVGSRKMVVYDDSSSEPVRVFDSGAILRDPATFGEYTLTYRTGDILSPHVEAAEPLYRELEDFCRAILEGTAPRSSAMLGLEVVRTIEAVDASLAASGARVEMRTAGTLAAAA
jgi:predicted dehydrogenase